MDLGQRAGPIAPVSIDTGTDGSIVYEGGPVRYEAHMWGYCGFCSASHRKIQEVQVSLPRPSHRSTSYHAHNQRLLTPAAYSVGLKPVAEHP